MRPERIVALELSVHQGYIEAMPEVELLTANEAAVLAGVSPDHIRRYVATGRLTAVRDGRMIQIPRSAVQKLVRQCARCHERYVPKGPSPQPSFCPACAPLARRGL